MKIGIVGKFGQDKTAIAKRLSLEFGLKVAPDSRKAAKSRMRGVVSNTNDAEILYYIYMEMITNQQVYDMTNSQFVNPYTYIDFFNEYFSNKNAVESRREDILSVCKASMSYYDIVFVLPGAKMPVIDFEKQGLCFCELKKDGPEEMADEAIRVIADKGIADGQPGNH